MTILPCVAGKTRSQFWRRFLLIRQCAITGLGLNSQKSLDTCLLVMVQESMPSHCIFSYLELHYYNHWSYIELYIWSTASSLVNIFVGGSVIHLVIQEITILWKKQIQMVQLIILMEIKVNTLIFYHEPPTPNWFYLFIFLRSWRLGNGSLKAEILFFMWFIKCVTLKDLSGMKI